MAAGGLLEAAELEGEDMGKRRGVLLRVSLRAP